MLVSGGYPGDYEKGKTISGLNNAKDCLPFHAGTSFGENGEIRTAGGRVLAITSFGKDIKDAAEQSYLNAIKINFEKMYFRKDIGKDLLEA